jgi:alkylhydroperoxidase/carboxymuconolactone decarboxylase family protein YurZ
MVAKNKTGKVIMNSIKKMILGSLVVLMSACFSVYGQQTPEAAKRLNVKQESIIPIAAYTAKGDQDALKVALSRGLDAGLTINEIKEILVQLYAYTGFPRSLNAINSFQSVLNERKQKGIMDVPGKEPGKQTFKNGKFAFGKDVQTKLTGSTATGQAQIFVPAIDTMLKEHLFADIFSRDNLDYQSREIATISALVSLGGTGTQLRAHLHVGRNVGLTEQQLRAIAFTLSTKVGLDEGDAAAKILDNMYGVKSAVVANPQSNVLSKGDKVVNDNFTGDAWVNRIMQTDTAFNMVIGKVTFSQKARSNWHRHSSGQILLITDGLGYYQEKGKPIRCCAKAI